MIHIHDPGSRGARADGCTCSWAGNNGGIHPPCPPDGWRIAEGCLLHGGRTVDPYHLRGTTRDGDLIVLGRCPGCGVWGDLDDDQLCGRVSTHHDTEDGGCGYHDTINWIERYTA